MNRNQLVGVLCVVFLSACNSGGSRKTIGRQCPGGDYKPFSMEIGPNQHKLSLREAVPPGALPVGKYQYDGSTLYYVDKSDLRIEVQDVKQKDSSFKPNSSCVRNSKNSFHAVSVESVRNLEVSASGKMTVDVNQYGISIDGAKFKLSAQVEPNKKLESPTDAYVKAGDAFFVSTDGNTTNYEIRSTATDTNGTYILQVRLVRSDLP